MTRNGAKRHRKKSKMNVLYLLKLRNPVLFTFPDPTNSVQHSILESLSVLQLVKKKTVFAITKLMAVFNSKPIDPAFSGLHTAHIYTFQFR